MQNELSKNAARNGQGADGLKIRPMPTKLHIRIIRLLEEIEARVPVGRGKDKGPPKQGPN